MVTPGRAIRVPDDLWDAVRVKATAENRTITDIIVTALRAYIGETVKDYGEPWPEPKGRNLQR